MKRSLLLITGIIFSINITAQQQIGNGNMESWDNFGTSSEEPSNWNSFKTAQGGLSSFGGQAVWRSTAIRAGATGSYCTQVKCISVLGVAANGVLTLGRVNMGSSTATSSSNYNVSLTSDVNFSEPLTNTPDSIVFWVKYSNSNSAHQARISAVMHDTYNYIDGYNVDPASAPHKVAEISYNFNATGGLWVRKSVPWVYTGPASANTFILVTFATNKVPGTGTVGDEVLIDDIQLIYNPVNQQVVANDDAISTFQDQAVNIDVAANDTDPENDLDLTSVTITTSPTNGIVNVNPTSGVVTYTPNAGYFGNDSFEYQICDNGTPVYCDIALVSITIIEVVAGNNPIVANPDDVITDMDVAVTTDVVANDVDYENNIDLSSLTITVQPTNGSAVANTLTGEVTYTPNLGFFGNDAYTYSICDAGTPAITCDNAVVSVTVNLTWGIEETSSDEIQVALNGNEISIIGNDLNGTYSIYATNGMLVQNGTIQNKISFQNLKGIYFIHLNSSKGTFTKKIALL